MSFQFRNGDTLQLDGDPTSGRAALMPWHQEPGVLLGHKPIGPVVIDLSHDIGANLIYYWPGTGAVSANGGAAPSTMSDDGIVWEKNTGWRGFNTTAYSSSLCPIEPSAHGLARVLPSTSDNFLESSVDHNIAENINPNAFSWFCDFYLRDYDAGSQSIFGWSNAGPGYTLLFYRVDSGNAFRCYVDNGSAAWVEGPSVVKGVRYRMVGTFDSSNIKFYINGDHVGTTALSGAITPPQMQVAFNRFASASRVQSDYYSAGFINGALTESQAKSLSRNPYQFLKPAGP